jgi:eukaryotic-like serine/threonine-protein kinase
MKPSRYCGCCGRELPSHAPEGLCPNCLLDSCAAEFGIGSEVQGSTGNGEPGTRKGGDSEVQGSWTRFFGNYELLEKIGEGGMGVVYKARQINLNRLVAVKLLPFGQFNREDAVQRFRTEAAAAASLQHPNIVAIHDVGEHEGQQYFSMDLIAGRTLAEVVQAQLLPVNRSAAYLRTIAEAVQYAHQHGIVHRDLKPSNVLVDSSDQPHITDFGLAKQLGQKSEEGGWRSDLTITGQVLGSPNFMAPEQAEGRSHAIGPASDIYSLGALLYHLLTRQPPFQADTLTTLLKQVIEIEPAPPRLLNPSIPHDLETICLKCLEKEPTRRYPTAQALADDLGRFLEDKPIQARPVSAVSKAWKWSRRRPALAGMGVALALTGALGLAGVLWQWHRARQSAQAELEQRKRAEASAYASDMRLAQLALAENNRGLAVSLLDKYRPIGKSETRNPKSEVDLRGWEWRYLWQLCQGDELLTLHRSASRIESLAVSKDGKLLAVATWEEIALWDLAARRPLRSLRPGASGPMAFSPAENCLAIGNRADSEEPGVEFWELGPAKLDKMLKRLKVEARVRSLAISPNGKLLATFDSLGGIKVVDWRSGQMLTHLSVAAPRLGGSGIVTFSPDGSRLAIGEGYGQAQLLTLPTGPVKQLATPPGAVVQALAFAPTADLLAGGYWYSAKSNRVMSLWDSHSGALRGQLTNRAEAAETLAFTSDSRRLIAGNSDGTIRTWSTIDYSELGQTLHSSGGAPGALHLLPDDRTLVSAGERSVCLWDLTAGSRAFSHTNLAVAFPSERLGELAPDQLVAETLDPRAVRRTAFAFTPDRRAFLTTDEFGSLVRWDSRSVQPTETLATLGSNHWGLAFSPEGRWLAAGEASGKLTVWEWPAQRAVTNFSVPVEFLGILRFSERGRFLHCAVANNQSQFRIRLWRTGDWAEVPLKGSPFAGLAAIAISPDDQMLAGGYEGGAVKLFRFPLANPEAAWQHNGPVYGVAFSPDGSRLISTSLDGSVMLWDVATREKWATLQGHAASVWAAAFSPDGRRLASGGTGPADAVILWDLTVHQQLLSLPGNGRWSFHIAFSPDGNTLTALSISGAAELWRAPSWEEIEAAERGR